MPITWKIYLRMQSLFPVAHSVEQLFESEQSSSLKHSKIVVQKMSVSKTLRVFNLNAWGFRLVSSGLKEKKSRFEALRDILARNEFDVALLQEVWYRCDYDLLKATFPYSSYLSDHYSRATGNLVPVGCSGLVILSKFPLEEVEFFPFKRRGGLLTFDRERIRVEID